MDKKVISQILELFGEEAAIKAVCNITTDGPIDEKLHHQKIKRARWFGLLNEDSLTLTEIGKLFAVKILFDLAENMVEGQPDDDNDSNFDEADEDDFDEKDFEDFDNDDDFFDEDDWEDDNWDEDDTHNGSKGKGRRR